MGRISLGAGDTARAQETCLAPTDIPGPGSYGGDTTGAVGDYDPGQFGCTGADASGPDHVLRFVPTANGLYDLSLVALDSSYDPSLWVFTDCLDPEGSCIAGADAHGHPVTERIDFLPLLASQTYFFAVDGYDDQPFGLPWGPYRFDLQPSVVPDGCASARSVPMLPFAELLDTALGGPDIDPSPGCGLAAQGGADLVWRLEPPDVADVTITVSPIGFDASLYAIGDCAMPAASCVAGADASGSGGTETIVVTAGPGSPRFVVVDCAVGGTGKFEIAFVAGESCASPVVASPLPFVADGDSSIAGNDINVSATSCTGARTRSSDVVYELSDPAGAWLDLTLEAVDLAYDVSLYVVTDCANPDTTCVAGSDAGGEGVPETIRLLYLPPGQPHYAVVDSFIPFEAGFYRFRAERSSGAILRAVRSGSGVLLDFDGNGPTFRITRADDELFTVNFVVLDPAAPGPTLTDPTPGAAAIVFYDAR